MKVIIPLTIALGMVLFWSTAAVLRPREPQCQLVHEQPVAPVRTLNREHVIRDVEAIGREAARFAAAVAARPPASDSIDAKAGARTAPVRAAAWCRATLVADLAAMHQTSEAALLAAVAGSDEGQADADRTSRDDSVSPVVSRPSR